VLQQALDREDMPAEAGMRQDLSHKLRQVEGQLQAQREQAGPRQEAGPKEAGPRPTTPTCTTCTTPTCGAAESVAVAAEAEASATAGPSEQGCEQTSSSSEQAPVARLLLELSDDLLLVCTARACAPHVPVHRTCLACACAWHVHVPCACCMCMCMCMLHVACACARAMCMLHVHVHCRRSYASWAWLTCSVPPRAAACSTAPVPRAAATGRGTGCARWRGRG
jgi:hypothetical protein